MIFKTLLNIVRICHVTCLNILKDSVKCFIHFHSLFLFSFVSLVRLYCIDVINEGSLKVVITQYYLKMKLKSYSQIDITGYFILNPLVLFSFLQ